MPLTSTQPRPGSTPSRLPDPRSMVGYMQGSMMYCGMYCGYKSKSSWWRWGSYATSKLVSINI